VTSEEKAQILRLAASGLTAKQVSATVKRPLGTVYNVLHRNEHKTNGHAPHAPFATFTDGTLGAAFVGESMTYTDPNPIVKLRTDLIRKRTEMTRDIDADIDAVERTLSVMGVRDYESVPGKCMQEITQVLERAGIPNPHVEGNTIPEAIEWIGDHYDGVVDVRKWAPILFDQGGFGEYANQHAVTSAMAWYLRNHRDLWHGPSRTDKNTTTESRMPIWRRKSVGPVAGTLKPYRKHRPLQRDHSAYALPSYLDYIRLGAFKDKSVLDAAVILANYMPEGFRLNDLCRVLWVADCVPQCTEHRKMSNYVWWPLNKAKGSLLTYADGLYRLKK